MKIPPNAEKKMILAAADMFDWTECDCIAKTKTILSDVKCECGCNTFYNQVSADVYHWRGKHWLAPCILNQLQKEMKR